MLFEGVAAGASQLDDLSDANAPMFASLIQDLHGKIRQACKHQLFPFHLFREPSHLLMQGGKKKQQPGSPVGGNCADRCLRLSQREIVSLLVLLDGPPVLLNRRGGCVRADAGCKPTYRPRDPERSCARPCASTFCRKPRQDRPADGLRISASQAMADPVSEGLVAVRGLQIGMLAEKVRERDSAGCRLIQPRKPAIDDLCAQAQLHVTAERLIGCKWVKIRLAFLGVNGCIFGRARANDHNRQPADHT